MRHGGSVLSLVAPATSWGLFWGGWAALIPTMQSDLGLGDRQLGLALFAVPVAAVPAMLLTGPLARRLGPLTLPLVTALFALGTLAVALAGSRWTFSAALLLVGAASGAIEVALNATTAAREALTGERLFNKVQAATPLAMVLAAPAVGLALNPGVSPRVILVVIAALVAVSAVLAIDRRRWEEQDAAEESEPSRDLHGDHAEDPGASRRFVAILLLVGTVGGTVLLMENTVEQWGAIHLRDALHAGSFVAACGPAAYMAGLSVGRMLAQWRGDRVADRTLIAVGGAVGGIGLAVSAAAWSTASTLAGFALAGIGLAPVVPTLLAATGRAVGPRRRPHAISMVTTVSYAGFLGAPPLVGVLAGWFGLSAVLGIIALCGVLVVMGSQVLRLLPAVSDTSSDTSEVGR
ncbi:MFS transporter [Streptomyces sp. SID3343]|uniref:MFS transporter n=1 Tax=Streptomyces sp. SID3343 TaxID=2690260 RepID=UPI00136C9278|nr:MFS transporter [Streptomyces sp. SID3343]MYW01928.1 MFS transporter [Streptomyces sp. SID3343]